MRIGYLECFAGISGDMLLGSLIDCGVPTELLRDTAQSLGLGATLAFTQVDRSGVAAQKARVLVNVGEGVGEGGGEEAEQAASRHHAEEQHHHHDHAHEHAHSHVQAHHHGRTLPAIRDILHAAPISAAARALALRAFALLAEAEASIHNVPVDQVHFHEVGAVDAIVDITCAAAGLTSLGIDRWYASPVNVGSGFVDCAHGRYPVPAPATASLLRGAPIYSEGPAMELVTPTGAAMLRALDCAFTLPAASFNAIGYGAGSRNPARFPNVLRLSIGDTASIAADDDRIARETVTVLECAIDDLSPQVLAHTAQLALEHGALDVTTSAIAMKKGRLGTLLSLLCTPADAPRFEELLFRETSTLGVRSRTEQRRILDRAHHTVRTPYGSIRIKTATLDGTTTHAQPEYDDCHARALEHRVPLKQVLDAAMEAWRAQQPAQHPAATAGAGQP